MHQNVTLTHNYKEKVFSFSSITSIEKLCTEKRGMVTRRKLSHVIQSTWFMRCSQIKTLTVKLSSFTRLQIAFPLKKNSFSFHSPALVLAIFLFIVSSHQEKEKHSGLWLSAPSLCRRHHNPQIKQRSPAAKTAATLGYFKIESILSLTGIFLQLLLLSSRHLRPNRRMKHRCETVPMHHWHVLSLHLRTGATEDIDLISIQM